MSQHAQEGGLRSSRRLLTALVTWHDSRPRASFDTARGWWWAALVAATLFWMSNPLVFIPSFYLSLGQALIWTKVVLVISLPWLRLPRVPWPWLAFLGLALLSQAWTIQPFYTDVSITVYIQITVLALVAAANCEPLVIGWGMAIGGASVALLSLFALHQQVPGVEYSTEAGMVFGGIGTNENILSYTLTVSLAAALAVGRPRQRVASAAWTAVLAVLVYGVYRADSGTGFLTALGLVIAVAAMLAWPLARAVRRRVVVAFAAGGAVTLTLSVLAVSAFLDKDVTTFSGRVGFWRAIYDSTLALAPWLGSGWGAVWQHPWDPAANNHVAIDINYRAGYGLPHGHNFFLDVLPELGIVGVATVVLMVVYSVIQIRSCGLHLGGRDPQTGRLVFLVLISLLISGITEPMLTVPLGWWSLALVVGLSRQRVQQRGRVAGSLSPAGSRSTPAARRHPRVN